MKHLKTFNESLNLENIGDIIKTHFEADGSLEINVKNNNQNSCDFSIEYCPVEPEIGSYTQRTCIDGTIRPDADGKLKLYASLISGQYGCEEEEEDSGFEPEMDWEVSASTSKISEIGLSSNQVIEKLDEFISDYI